jgi:hypothetical protein
MAGRPKHTLLEASEALTTISESLHDLQFIVEGLSKADEKALMRLCDGLDVHLDNLAQAFDVYADHGRFLAHTPTWAGGRASERRPKGG